MKCCERFFYEQTTKIDSKVDEGTAWRNHVLLAVPLTVKARDAQKKNKWRTILTAAGCVVDFPPV